MMKLMSLLLAATIASTPAAAQDVGAVRQIIADPDAGTAPGCAVGAFRGGKTLFTTAAGYADIEAKRPLDADTLFYAASVSKQFTALAAAKLIEQGKLGLDDDIRKYLSELPAYETPVTVRMLMLHTAGIRDWIELALLAGVQSSGQIDKASALQLLFRQKGTNFTPGTSFTYSNGGYLLLAEIVERVAGMPFADYAKKAILDPLGMKRSFFMNDRKPSGSNIAHGYVPVGESFEIRDTYPNFSGSGGLMVSINDLARFHHDIESGHRIWTPAVRKIMMTPGTFTNGQPALVNSASQLAYGGGLMIGMRKGQHFVQHGGGAEAFRNLYALLPERRLGVAVFCNRGDWAAEEKADAIIELIEGDVLTEEIAGKSPLDGRYVSEELGATYDIAVTGDQLKAAITSPLVKEAGPPLEFKRSGNEWSGAYGTRLVFDEDGRSFTIRSGRVHNMRFRRSD